MRFLLMVSLPMHQSRPLHWYHSVNTIPSPIRSALLWFAKKQTSMQRRIANRRFESEAMYRGYSAFTASFTSTHSLPLCRPLTHEEATGPTSIHSSHCRSHSRDRSRRHHSRSRSRSSSYDRRDRSHRRDQRREKEETR